jgi:ABC-2 type transport system ATP-binding protein
MLELSHVSKSFPRGRKPALNDVSFSVSPGEIVGLLGHNGAGKSTAVGIMLGMIYPDAGEVVIAGKSVAREKAAALSQTGAIFEAPHFYDYLTGWQNLKVLTAFSPGPVGDLAEVVDWVNLTPRIHDRVQTYSHGMRARLALAQALLPRPQFLLLDEPTNGLDPDGIAEFRQQIRVMRKDFGLTILLCSHLLGEVEQLCDRVVILREGEKIYEGDCQKLQSDQKRYRIVTEASAPWETNLGATAVGPVEDRLFTFPQDQDMADTLRRLVESGASVSEFTPVPDSLEELYLELR